MLRPLDDVPQVRLAILALIRGGASWRVQQTQLDRRLREKLVELKAVRVTGPGVVPGETKRIPKKPWTPRIAPGDEAPEYRIDMGDGTVLRMRGAGAASPIIHDGCEGYGE